MTNDDVTIIGRSGIPTPTEHTNEQLVSKFAYSYNSDHRGWGNDRLYYQGKDDPEDVNSVFLGYKHNNTGVILMLQNYRRASNGVKTIYKLDGTKTVSTVFKDDSKSNYLHYLTNAMDAIDSKRKNWDVVVCSVKPSVAPVFKRLHLWTSSEYMPDTDLSMVFQADKVIQKGCKTIPKVQIPVTTVALEKTNKIEELIV